MSAEVTACQSAGKRWPEKLLNDPYAPIKKSMGKRPCRGVKGRKSGIIRTSESGNGASGDLVTVRVEGVAVQEGIKRDQCRSNDLTPARGI